MASRTINREGIIDIIYGATFFGAGGGGSIDNGMDLLNQLNDDVSFELVPLKDIESDAYSVLVGGLGSPLALKEKGFGPEALYVVDGMISAAREAGKNAKYIYSGEQGGFNTMVPLYAAILKKMAVLDLDGNGRAVPELNTGLLPINNIPIDPLVMSNQNGDIVIGHPQDPLDSVACETIARAISTAFGMSVGFSTWLMGKNDHEKASAIGQLSLSQKVGAILRDPKTNETNISQFLNAADVKHKIFGVGEIANIDVKVENGFDFGSTKILCEGGKQFKITFKNENLIIWDEKDNALLVVPEIITLVDMETMKPLSNADTKKGQRVMLLGVSAPEKWWSNPRGYECWSHILKQIGYSKAEKAIRLEI